jgi:type I restriction enzyme S subunit
MNNSAEAKVEVGFKQTEVGLIPEDWEVKKLGDIGDVKMCKRIFSYQTSKRGDVPFYKIGTFGKEPDAFISWELYQEFKKKYSFPNDGSLLISASGTIGRTVEYYGEDSYYQDSNIIWLDNDEKLITNQYLKYILKIIKYQTEGSTIKRLYNSIIKRSEFILPPTLTEQRTIATALSDVDELINSLEKLIAKKKAIKQGAMQELLTPPNKGGKRLAGFSGDWVERKLGEIGDCIIGLTYSPSDVSDLGTLVLRSSNIQNNKLSFNDNVYVTSDIPEKLRNQMGDILICVRNGSRNLIGKSAKIDERCSGETFGAFMSIFRSKYNDFLYHCFNSYPIKKQIEENLGATINQITNKTLNSFDVWMPKDEKEMYSISNLLDDMDLEIDSLETKKEKYKSVKDGMMQELLTGKIRLV